MIKLINAVDRKTRCHIHELELKRAGYTVEEYHRKFFSWSLEMDNDLVSPTLES